MSQAVRQMLSLTQRQHVKAQQQQRLTVLDEPARPHGRASLAPTTRTVAELQGLGSLLSAAELRAAVASPTAGTAGQ